MEIQLIYQPILRQVTKPVTVFDAELKRQADEMVKVMHANRGMGLAANQVGLDKQLFVIEYQPEQRSGETPIPLMQLCNPKILKYGHEAEEMIEGCLSIPGLEMPVIRPRAVVVQAQTLQGKTIKIKAKGLLAKILQHEIDHLNGHLFTDRAEQHHNQRDLEYCRFAKIVFLGSDDFSQVILQALLKARLNVVGVITETAKPAGRGRGMEEPIIKSFATSHHLPVLQPADKPAIVAALQRLQPDLVVLASYGKILPAEALAIPALGSLNIHPSLLPKYRGATPIQSAIFAGETTTGVSLMVMNAGVDTGGVVAQKDLTIAPTDTTPTLRQHLAKVGAELLLSKLPDYLLGQATIAPQSAEAGSGTVKFSKEMGRLDWQQSATVLDRQIRAYQPWPGTFTELNGKRLKIIRSHLENERLCLDEVQLEGKQVTNWRDFVRGHEKELTKTDWYSKIC